MMVTNDPVALAIPLPSEAAVSQWLGPSYDASRTLDAVRILAGAGDLAGPAIHLMQAVFKSSAVDAKTRELMILRTAKAVGCEYALRAGTVIAANTGLTAEEIGAAKGDAYAVALTPDHMLLCRVADELSTGGSLSDPTLRILLARHDDETCRKLVLMVCWFNLVNRFENGCRVPFESFDKLATMTSPQA